MKIENNRNLFYTLVGLVTAGANAYDHNDNAISALAERICGLDISDDIKTWFTRARTGQVEVNPYWPRGSALTTACFYIDYEYFDIDAFFTFFESVDVPDPIGDEDFRKWIINLPVILSYLETHSEVQPLWEEYCRIVNARKPSWSFIMDETLHTAKEFFCGQPPDLSFSPNLLTAYSTDFVRVGNRIVTIAPEPDVESILHEMLHTVVAVYRDKIMAFSEKYGLANFANREKMIEFGYMTDNSVAAITHVIEECFVRAAAVVLAKKTDDRLRFHAEYGCDSVPLLASHFKTSNQTVTEFEAFIDTVLENKKSIKRTNL